MIRLKIDVKKIDESALFAGKKGTYCDITLMENRDGPDEYGNDGFAVQDIGKERRLAGEKGPIIGNWKRVETKGRDVPAAEAVRKKQPAEPTQPDDDCDDVPF